jgi:signal transduction histidine kinase
MGLLIAQLIVQTYGGNIKAEDSQHGATLTMSLPLESSP